MPDTLHPFHTRLDIQSDQRRARDLAWESVRGQREPVSVFLAEGLSMLSLGEAAGIPAETLVILAGSVRDAVSDRIGEMQRTLDDAHCALDPAHVDLTDLDALIAELEGRIAQ